MKKIAVILIGCGGVGRQLLQHIVRRRSLHAKQGVRLQVLGVCDSQSLVFSETELDDELLSMICKIKARGSSVCYFGGYVGCQVFNKPKSMKKVIEIATLLGKSTGLAVVDCSSSSETIGVLNQVVKLGCCSVLANKKPLTSTLEDYDKLFSYPRRIRHESTVGARLPVIASLNRIIASGDPVHRIIGSLSGTLGYVMSEVENGKPLSQVVKAAKSLGYTEPDPRDDLSGMDIARKALILARLLGMRINLDSIKIESLYPEEMGPNVMSIEQFLDNGVLLLDYSLQQRVKKASSNGNVLRHFCVIEGSSCEVGILELPKYSRLGSLRGSENMLQIYSRCYQEPLVIQGAGAGAGNDTTAACVLADILDLQDLFP